MHNVLNQISEINRSTLKEKNLLLREQILFFRSKSFSLRVGLNAMVGKNKNKRVASPESVHFHFKQFSRHGNSNFLS